MSKKTAGSTPDEDLNQFRNEIRNIYLYLNKFADVDGILGDKKAKNYINLIVDYLDSSTYTLDVINLAIQSGFARVIVALIRRNLEILKLDLAQLNEKNTDGENSHARDSELNCSDELSNHKTIQSKKKKIYKFPISCLIIVVIFTNYSKKFSSLIYRCNVLKCLFDYLRFGDVIYDYLNSKSKYTHSVASSTIDAIFNLSKLHDQFIDKWKEENPIEFLLDLSELLKNKDNCQISINIILANIVDEDGIKKLDNLNAMKKVIPGIVSIIDAMSKRIETKQNLKRTKIYFGKNLINVSKIAKLTIGRNVWHLGELIDSLYHMTVNDSIKYEIYNENKMDDILRRLIYFGNETEIQYSLKLLWQLCFDQRIAQHVNNDQKFMAKIKEIYESKPSDLTTKNCNGLLWLIDKKLNQTQAPVDNKHIMISYNRETRDLCLKIKQELEKDHYKVWIDVESISGSSLESMADAVENSMCVLMCMTEKYKMSPYCRAEAEYAFQVGKPIVPLIMQANYKPDGWLGNILDSKKSVNFTNYDFNEFIPRLKSELFNQIGDKKGTNELETITSSEIVSQNPDATNWTQDQVKSWLKDKNIHQIIIENVFPSDGAILHQLCKMIQESPEFFYKSITSRSNTNIALTVKDIASFVLELKKLFNVNN